MVIKKTKILNITSGISRDKTKAWDTVAFLNSNNDVCTYTFWANI